MKKIKYICDKCSKEIEDVYYSLTCYAQCVPGENPAKHSAILALQNLAQNKGVAAEERHLCKTCKDAITDGIFIV